MSFIRSLTNGYCKQRLEKMVPGFGSEWRSSIKLVREDLEPIYKEYITTISTDRSAISLELACFLMVMCQTIKPGSILDVGSGFSSYVFRTFQAGSTQPVTVYSLDNEELWLIKSKEFLTKAGLQTRYMMSFDSFEKEMMGKVSADLILHDLGNFDERKKHLIPVSKCGGRGSVMVVDDLHKKHYREYVKNARKQFQNEFVSLRPYTLDKFGRYSGLLKLQPTELS